MITNISYYKSRIALIIKDLQEAQAADDIEQISEAIDCTIEQCEDIAERLYNENKPKMPAEMTQKEFDEYIGGQNEPL